MDELKFFHQVVCLISRRIIVGIGSKIAIWGLFSKQDDFSVDKIVKITDDVNMKVMAGNQMKQTNETIAAIRLLNPQVSSPDADGRGFY